jgi:hypothetical protein
MKYDKIIKITLILGSVYYFIGAIVHFFGLSIYPWYDSSLFSVYHDTVISLSAIIFGLLLLVISQNVEKYRQLINWIIAFGIIAIIFSLYIVFCINLTGSVKKEQTIVEMVLLIIYTVSLGYFNLNNKRL